jgi:biopolymer transport protein ExbD
MRKQKKHLDFEINLVPCIDLLSTCICFLLLTAVWLQVGSMNVKQAVGGQPTEETTQKPVVWVNMAPSGELVLDVQDTAKVPAKFRKLKINAKDGKPDFAELTTAVKELRGLEPLLATALIQPTAASAYEDIIELMDRFKNEGLIDLGVAPL